VTGVPEPQDVFEIITSDLLALVGIAIELEEHDKPENSQYWHGFRDGICMLLGDLAGKKPVIVNEEAHMKVIDMRLETEIESMFPEDIQ
jgi:hypothetical protein